MRQSDLSRFGIGTAKKQPEPAKTVSTAISPEKPKTYTIETRSSGQSSPLKKAEAVKQPSPKKGSPVKQSPKRASPIKQQVTPSNVSEDVEMAVDNDTMTRRRRLKPALDGSDDEEMADPKSATKKRTYQESTQIVTTDQDEAQFQTKRVKKESDKQSSGITPQMEKFSLKQNSDVVK